MPREETTFSTRGIQTTDIIRVEGTDGTIYKMRWSDVETFVETYVETFPEAEGIIISGAATNGILISGKCTDGIEVSGACTTYGINVSGDIPTSLNIINTVTTGRYGIYNKNTVTGFAGSDFVGAYIRAESATNAATAKSLYGAIIYGTANAVTHTTGSLWGQLTYAYVKGDVAATINNIYAIQAEFTMDASRANNLTITTEAAVILAKVTAGKMADDTKLNGIIIRLGDMDGDSATFGTGILIEDDSAMSGTCGLTKGINISANCTDGISFNNSCSGDFIDFSGVTYEPTGSAGPCLIRAGTYGNPATTTFVENADEDQSGFIRLYGATSADGTSYDRGVFSCLVTTGKKGIFPVAGLAEVRAQSSTGPTAVGAAQFIAHLNSATAVMGARSGNGWANFYGAWLKVASNVGSVASSGSVVCPLWVDTQMNGTVSGEYYSIFCTTGTAPDAFVGFEASAGCGHDVLFYWDDTCYNLDPISALGCKQEVNSDGTIKIKINATTYYIPYYAVANCE